MSSHLSSPGCGNMPAWLVRGLERQRTRLGVERASKRGAAAQRWGTVGCPGARSRGSGQPHKPLPWSHGEGLASPCPTAVAELCRCKEVTDRTTRLSVSGQRLGHALTVTFLFFLTDPAPILPWFPCLKTLHSPPCLWVVTGHCSSQIWRTLHFPH